MIIFNYLYNKVKRFFQLDPLDPLTEIIQSGQAFSLAIALERFIWLMIGIFFLGAISKSIFNITKNQVSISRKSIFHYFKLNKHEDEESQ